MKTKVKEEAMTTHNNKRSTMLFGESRDDGTLIEAALDLGERLTSIDELLSPNDLPELGQLVDDLKAFAERLQQRVSSDVSDEATEV